MLLGVDGHTVKTSQQLGDYTPFHLPLRSLPFRRDRINLIQEQDTRGQFLLVSYFQISKQRDIPLLHQMYPSMSFPILQTSQKRSKEPRL